MKELVFDTNIIIDHLRGVSQATKLIEQVKQGTIVGYISILTEAELFAGKDSENATKRAFLVELLSLFTKIDVNENIARIGGEFRRNYKISLADAMIAATAFVVRCTLITRNVRDFKMIAEIHAEEPYRD